MSVGTSDTTVISSTKTEARNLNTIDASAATRDDSSPATIPTTTPKNRQSYLLKMRLIASTLLKVFGDATMYVSCGGPLTRSGSLLSIEGMSLDAVVDGAVATQHYAGI